MSRRTYRGGPGGHAGYGYQDEVAACIAVQMLAEGAGFPCFGLPVGVRITRLECETDRPVDDLLVKASDGRQIPIQAKSSIRLLRGPDSPFAETVYAFVDEVLAHRGRPQRIQPSGASAKRTPHCLVLACGPESSGPIRVSLRKVLDRVRRQDPQEPLVKAVLNNDERRALDAATEHIQHRWENRCKVEPRESDVRDVLKRVHVEEVGRAAEDRAHDLLRDQILTKRDEAERAWDTLCQLCGELAKQSSGIDVKGLQDELIRKGFDLRSAPSYRSDIEKLKGRSLAAAGALERHSSIRVGEGTVTIKRSFFGELRQAAESASLLLVGEPGVGKSGLLSALSRELLEERHDVVLLVVDQIGPAESLGALRQELNLEHDLVEVFENWHGSGPAFLVVDALDAARARPQTVGTLRDLIEQVARRADRWRVVASIREFDLRYTERFKKCFRGEPPTELKFDEFHDVCHIAVPRLGNSELAQVEAQSEALGEVIQQAKPKLRELLAIPYNLNLVAELLGARTHPAELGKVESQLDLLDKYWDGRVIRDDGQRNDRERVLEAACRKMIQDRNLQVERVILAGQGLSEAIEDLLSSNVLVEQRSDQVLAFSDHVLFDYAVERLLVSGDPRATVPLLEQDRFSIFLIRPSLELHYRRSWKPDEAHVEFWELVLAISRSDRISALAKIVGPIVASELMAEPRDVEELYTSLTASDRQVQAAAVGAVRHLVGAALVGLPEAKPLAGPASGPWSEFAETVSRRLLLSTAMSLAALLNKLCAVPRTLTEHQHELTNAAARRLAEFAWAHKASASEDYWLVTSGIRAVCRTFEGNPRESGLLLGRCLEDDHLNEYGIAELPVIAHEARYLIPHNPDLVELLYKTAFRPHVVSVEDTAKTVPRSAWATHLSVEAVQALAEAFPEYMEKAPKHATEALIVALDSFVEVQEQRRSFLGREPDEERFEFRGVEARIQSDFSSSWEDGSFVHPDGADDMLDVWARYVRGLGELDGGQARLDLILRTVAEKNKLACVWRRLLIVGRHLPEHLTPEIAPLAWAMPILKSYDTRTEAGEFLKAAFAGLPENQRKRIEEAILRIPETYDADSRGLGEINRNRFLGCLSLDYVVTEDARLLLAHLIEANAVPPNELPFRVGEVGSMPLTTEMLLQDQGIDTGTSTNKHMLDLIHVIESFCRGRNQAIPSMEEIRAVLPRYQELYRMLTSSAAESIEEPVRDTGWAHLAEGCKVIAKTDEALSCHQTRGFLLQVLLRAASHPVPEDALEDYTQFDEHPIWSGPTPRLEAAVGLSLLARHPACATDEILNTVRQLALDAVPAVRYQVAARLYLIARANPQFAWQLLEDFCHNEERPGVLQAVLYPSLHNLAPVRPEDALRLTILLLGRVEEGPGAQEVRSRCIQIQLQLHLWRGHQGCRDALTSLLEDPVGKLDDIMSMILQLRSFLVIGPTEAPDPKSDTARRRALDLIRCVMRSTTADHEGLADRAGAGALTKILSEICRRYYYACSSTLDKDKDGRGQTAGLPPELPRFYDEARDILDEMVKVNVPELSYHLLHTLEILIPLDSERILMHVGTVARSARDSGILYDPGMGDLLVDLVGRYVAEYTNVLIGSTACQETLFGLVEMLIQADRPAAWQLALRLHEMFR